MAYFLDYVLREDEKQILERLMILAEECSEVTKCISKIMRFGLHDKDNQKNLSDELGDLLEMIDQVADTEYVIREYMFEAKKVKREKLKIWMTHQ